jgi:hypothetical protein
MVARSSARELVVAGAVPSRRALACANSCSEIDPRSRRSASFASTSAVLGELAAARCTYYRKACSLRAACSRARSFIARPRAIR